MARTEQNIDKALSRFKLVVYFKNKPDNVGHVFYSFLSEEKKGYEVCINGLLNRTIFKDDWRDKYNTALLFDTKASDKEIRKYVKGYRVYDNNNNTTNQK